MASQAMFGDTVFLIAPHCQEFIIYEALQEFGQVLEYNISTCVPKLMHD
jgi:pantoate kinase